MSVTFIKASDASVEVLHLGPITMRVLEDGSHTDNRLCAVEIILPPHIQGPPLHFHMMHDETFLITKGSVRFKTCSGYVDTEVGDYAIVPPKAVHTFENITGEEARMINTCTPAFYVDYFRSMARDVKNGKELSADEAFKHMALYATMPADEKENLLKGE